MNKPLVWKRKTVKGDSTVTFIYMEAVESVRLDIDNEPVSIIPIDLLYDFVYIHLLTNPTKQIGTARRAFQLRHSANLSMEELQAGAEGELDV
jgi:hypothetical protein